MNTRKTIACIMMYPEGIVQQRILEGLQIQCECYNYNLAVFSPLVECGLYYTDYLLAERNILNLPDYSKFDAVLIAATSIAYDNDYSDLQVFSERVHAKADIPVISMDYEHKNCYSIITDDTVGFYNITKHLIEEHSCKRIYMLTGFKNNAIAIARKSGFLKAMKEFNIPVTDDNIFYGDFWYTSGEELAEKIADGTVPMPDAVVCAGDHPAIGLANRLIQHGIKVPEQVIVTGYDSTPESVINDISITSYIPPTSRMAAEAVNMVRTLIEPDLPVCDTAISDKSSLIIGESCGCRVNSSIQKKLLGSSLYRSNRNYGDTSIQNINNLSTLLENYMLENLTKIETPIECLKLIYTYTYLIEPYDNFYLCLKPDWLDTDVMLEKGYPDTMRCVIHSVPAKALEEININTHCRDDERDNFDTSLMLPAMWEHTEKPSVFFFVPSHFSDNTLGYAVYSCALEGRPQLTIAFQMWMRNVNTALEMVRTRNKLIGSSLIDSMTKLNNRRGMTMKINDLLSVREENVKLLAMVIDMDGLKKINDTYGHNEGDNAIVTIATVVRFITEKGESSCRAGGDEFYILGVGNYTDEMVESKINQFYSMLENQNRQNSRPYAVTASIGYSITDIVDNDINMTEAIAAADSKMYVSKSQRKQQQNK